MEIKKFKLVSGIDVIGKLEEEQADAVVLRDVMMVQIQVNKQGQMMFYMVPYDPTEAEQVKQHRFMHSAIVSESLGVADEFLKEYHQRTSGIAIVGSV